MSSMLLSASKSSGDLNTSSTGEWEQTGADSWEEAEVSISYWSYTVVNKDIGAIYWSSALNYKTTLDSNS